VLKVCRFSVLGSIVYPDAVPGSLQSVSATKLGGVDYPRLFDRTRSLSVAQTFLEWPNGVGAA
jgi:hypothetical protein